MDNDLHDDDEEDDDNYEDEDLLYDGDDDDDDSFNPFKKLSDLRSKIEKDVSKRRKGGILGKFFK